MYYMTLYGFLKSSKYSLLLTLKVRVALQTNLLNFNLLPFSIELETVRKMHGHNNLHEVKPLFV